ncbi:MAG: DNA primase [Prevotella sp.]|nr:DNA primase [Prevotella sp.]
MIDRLTVEKIKDAANIVDVVSEFVTLKKSGANYKGLCPFHNEKTPSFMVSPARGTCHCFGCGKGGNAISFIMEHEQMTYPEALRWLAKKYNIEIQERELSAEEKAEQTARESMFIINEWTASYFEKLLHEHPDGQAIGLQYFRSRGFRDDIIKKFRLGFDINDRFALAATATKEKYNPEYLLKVGLCYKNDHGELIDRFAGRVMFPWVGVSGKIVAFGGRKLDAATKGVQQKYVNSPDSEIYHKDRELYGIYQGKKAIAKEDCVYMVEGYTDVLSLHQCGIENVVANSGTALSIHQIHTLHRFTSNIVLLYDGDAAGIHAAMRGTDMLLSEGMNLKVLLLPDNDDPDSFARKHTADEFRAYIKEHQTDFIEFKTKLLLQNETDPQKRADGIGSIVNSISLIPNQILRDTYIHTCAQRLLISENTLINQMNKYIRDRKEAGKNTQQAEPQQAESPTPQPQQPTLQSNSEMMKSHESKVEWMLIQMMVRHGEYIVLQNVETENGETMNVNIAQYIYYNLSSDNLQFKSEIFNKMLTEALNESTSPDFNAMTYFVHHPDINISRIAAAMSEDRYHLSEKAHTTADINEEERRRREEGEREALLSQTTHLLLDFRMDYVEQHLKELQQQIAASARDLNALRGLMQEFKDMQEIRNNLAKQLGSNVIV